MTELRAWPFLISRNKTRDYRLLVAPDFIVEKGESRILNKISRMGEQDEIVVDEMDTAIGIIGFCLRKIRAEIDNEVLKDEFNRPILWIEGVIFKESVKKYEISQNILEIIRPNLLKVYQRFWINDEIDLVLSSPVIIQVNKINKATSPPLSGKQNISGWSKPKSQQQRISQLYQERGEVDRNYKIGIACTVVGVPLIALGVGIILTPIGIGMMVSNHKKLQGIDEEIKDLKSAQPRVNQTGLSARG